MKKTLLSLAIWACGTIALAQQALGPGAGIGPDNEAQLKALFAAKPKLYWIGVGSADGVKVSASALRDYCQEKGYPYEYYESDGGHIWRNRHVYLTIFAQKLFK